MFRPYAPGIERWLTRDPAGELGTRKRGFQVPVMNLYNYTRNDPVNFLDPGGLDPSSWWQSWASRVFTAWKVATGGTESAPGEPPMDQPEQGPTDTQQPLEPSPSTGPGDGPSGGGGGGPEPPGPGGGSIQNIEGWFTWVPGSLCTPLIFPGHCFFFPTDASCGGGA